MYTQQWANEMQRRVPAFYQGGGIVEKNIHRGKETHAATIAGTGGNHGAPCGLGLSFAFSWSTHAQKTLNMRKTSSGLGD